MNELDPPPNLLAIVDSVGADIYARLVCEWLYGRVDDDDNDDDELKRLAFQRMADDALAAAFAWGLRRHQTIEPCDNRED